MKDELIKIANKLVEYEKNAENHSGTYNFNEVFELIKNLSLKDMLEIDTYIQENHLLTS